MSKKLMWIKIKRLIHRKMRKMNTLSEKIRFKINGINYGDNDVVKIG